MVKQMRLPIIGLNGMQRKSPMQFHIQPADGKGKAMIFGHLTHIQSDYLRLHGSNAEQEMGKERQVGISPGSHLWASKKGVQVFSIVSTRVGGETEAVKAFAMMAACIYFSEQP